MQRTETRVRSNAAAVATTVMLILTAASGVAAAGPPGGERKSPVRVAPVESRAVADQISLVGTTEAFAESTIAAEVSGIVEQYPAREGVFVKKGELLVKLRTTYRNLRLNGAVAARERTLASLNNAEKELARITKLKAANSVAQKAYDDALYNYQGLTQELLRNEAEIDQLKYEISQASVTAPFPGFVAREHTQVGEWINAGGAVVTLLDLTRVLITVDVPERYIVKLSTENAVNVAIPSISDENRSGRIFAILPQGNASARTFPVKVLVENPGFAVKSSMEAHVTFSLSERRQALLVPKDAVVTAGDQRLVFLVADGKAVPVPVQIEGYYGGSVAVEGRLAPGTPVVVRGNERLRPGQAVEVQN
jgi:RND family efflux transporter MFP subunit